MAPFSERNCGNFLGSDQHPSSFDPETGITIRQPDQQGVGYWVGGPGVMWDAPTNAYFLTYRRRRPAGTTPGRGYLSVIARSDDGIHFEDILAIHQDQLDTLSIERTCLRRLGDDLWALYIGFVDPADHRWRIDMVTATTPDRIDVRNRRPVLTAQSTGTEGVKDPYLVSVGPAQFLYVSYAATTEMTPAERVAAHSTADIYNQGVTTAPTGLATSLDGQTFDWRGTALGVGAGWDKQQARLNNVVACDGYFVGLYDGSANAEENYEERCGLALSFDLTTWLSLTPRGPLYQSPHASRSMRYTDIVTAGPRLLLYYEYALADGSHDLRVLPLSRPAAVQLQS